MSVHSLLGVFALDAVLVVVGASILWGLGVLTSPGEAVRLIGLEWLVGAATLAGLVSLELMVALPFGLVIVLATAAAVTAAGAIRGWLARQPRPRLGATVCGPLLVTAVGVAATALVLEAQFRAGRLSGLYEWDSMAFWVPKAKAIYFFGQFDPSFVAHLQNAWYPPLGPTLDAMAFKFMGRPDVVTLHLVYWSALAAFFAAAAGLLASRVQAIVLWPTLLALLTAPVIVNRGVSPLADLLLDYFLALAAILVVLWLSGSPPWCLGLAAGFLGAAALTKREGLLLAGCVVASGMVATWSSKRRAWPALTAMAVPAVALTIAWRIWMAAHGITNEAPEAGYFGVVNHVGRVWPSLHLTLHVLFGGRWWTLVPVLVVIGTVAALSARAGRIAIFSGTYIVLGILACTWVTLSFPSLPLSTNDSLNPIVRLTGGLVIPAAAVLPMVLSRAWSGLTPEARGGLE